MKKNVKFYKCSICRNVIGLIDGDPNKLECCNEPMHRLEPNNMIIDKEKEIPVCKKEGDKLIVNVGKIDHSMTEDDYIMWVAEVTDNQTTRVRLNPGELPQVVFPYVGNAIIYAYNNKGTLWATEFE